MSKDQKLKALDQLIVKLQEGGSVEHHPEHIKLIALRTLGRLHGDTAWDTLAKYKGWNVDARKAQNTRDGIRKIYRSYSDDSRKKQWKDKQDESAGVQDSEGELSIGVKKGWD